MISSQPRQNKLLTICWELPTDGGLFCFLEIGFDISLQFIKLSDRRKQVKFAQSVELCATYLGMQEVLFCSPEQSGQRVVWWPYSTTVSSAFEEPEPDRAVPEARVLPSNYYIQYPEALKKIDLDALSLNCSTWHL